MSPTPSKLNPDIKGILTSICLRRPKDAIKLPHRVDEVHKVEFDIDEAQNYRRMNDIITADLRRGGDGITDSHLTTYASILTKINALRQICNLGTHYQGTIGQLEMQKTPSAVAQELFDGLLSTGESTCARCRRDLFQGNLNSESLLGGTQDQEQPQPRMTTCGDLICASCSAQLEANENQNESKCRHEPSCPFFKVKISSSDGIPGQLTTQLPTKMRALQRDIQRLSISEKR